MPAKHHRITRKRKRVHVFRGGAEVGLDVVPTIFTCTPPRSKRGEEKKHEHCLHEFFQEFQYVMEPSSDDGDCFFYTMLEYARRFLPTWFEEIRRESLGETVLSMRNEVANYMAENLHRWIDSIDESNGETYDTIMETVRTKGAWNSQAGDFIIQFTAECYGLNLQICDFQLNEDTKEYTVTHFMYQSPEHRHTATILRTYDGHYQLLMDVEDYVDLPPLSTLFRQPNAPKKSRSSAAAPKKTKASITRSKKAAAPSTRRTRSKKAALSNNNSSGNNAIQMAMQMSKLTLELPKTSSSSSASANTNISREIQAIQNNSTLTNEEKEAMVMSLLR